MLIPWAQFNYKATFGTAAKHLPGDHRMVREQDLQVSSLAHTLSEQLWISHVQMLANS